MLSFLVYSQSQAILSWKIQKGLEALTGPGVKIEGLRFKNRPGLRAMESVRIAKIQIKNPSDFNQTFLAEATDIQFKIDFLRLLAGQWRIADLQVPIDRINLEINSRAELNLGMLGALQKKALQATPGPHFFHVQKMEFRIGTVYFYDARDAKNLIVEHYDFAGRMGMYLSLRRPEILVQALVLQLLYQLNKGSFGLPQDKIQEAVASFSKI